jgi:flagellar biosynthesis/type III secretory pathway chaperone
MPNPANITKELTELFFLQLQTTRRLFDILRCEYQILSDNNVTELENIVRQKQQCATDLSNNEQRIFELIRKENYSPNNNGLKTLLQHTQAAPHYHRLHAAWSELIKTTVQCNNQNHINARVINLASLSVRQALNLLSGHNESTELYNQDGKTSEGPGVGRVTVA